MDATVNNMRACEAAGVAAVMLDPITGDTFSATPGDYWLLAGDEPILAGDDETPNVLVRRVSYFEDIVLDAKSVTS